MGCLCSKEDPEVKYQVPKPNKLVTVLGNTFESAESRHAGIKFHPSAAAVAASPGEPLSTFVRVSATDDYLLTSLFDGYGGPAAAKHLHCRTLELLKGALGRCEQDTASAIKTVVEDLDRDLTLASTNAMDKATSGCSAVIAVLNLKTNEVHAACVGGGMCIVAHTSGSFKQAVTEARAVVDGRKAIPVQQALRAGHAVDDEAKRNAAAHTYGYAKDKLQDDVRPWPAMQPQFGSLSLGPGDDAVLLLSPGMLDLMTCVDTAIMANMFSVQGMQTYLDVAGAGQRASQAGAQNNSTRSNAGCDTLHVLKSTASVFNLAGLLAHYAASQASIAHKLPDFQQHLANNGRGRPLYSDAAVICMSIEFPKSLTSRQLAHHKTAAWVSRVLHSVSQYKASKGGAAPSLEAAAVEVAAPGAGRSAGEVSGTAVGQKAGASGSRPAAGQQGVNSQELCSSVPFRWRLVAQYMAFLSRRKQAVRQAWYATTKQLLDKADKQARQAELVTWQHLNEAVQVTRTGKVMRPVAATQSQFSASPRQGSAASVNVPVSPTQSSVGHGSVRMASMDKDRSTERTLPRTKVSPNQRYDLRSHKSKAATAGLEGDSRVTVQVNQGLDMPSK